MIEFKAWPKTPRLNRDMVVTEKIDGTNSAVIIDAEGNIGAQSRNRLVTPGKATDNYGFAQWVQDNSEALVRVLGTGRHFGEWWGKGIARGYGLNEKRFSLFNTERYKDIDFRAEGLDQVSLVPVLYEGAFSTVTAGHVVEKLRLDGSSAAPGFNRPEGVVFHTASQSVFKVTLEGDESPKALAGKL